jgi:hypothetical protein
MTPAAPATPALERAARATWRVQAAHDHADGCPDGGRWHPLLIEAWSPPGGDQYLVGDVWSPGDRPVLWLRDWYANPDTTALIVVTSGTMLTSAGVTPVHVVACVSRAGGSFVLAAPGDEPPPTGGRLCGPLYKAMLRAMSSNASCAA